MRRAKAARFFTRRVLTLNTFPPLIRLSGHSPNQDAKAAGVGIIVGGELYGQGSSREAAVMGPMHLGVRAVIAKSFARIHRANLVNWGLVPLVFDDPNDWDGLERDDRLRLDGLRAALAAGSGITITNMRSGARFTASCVLTSRERDILLAGGVLAHTRGASA